MAISRAVSRLPHRSWPTARRNRFVDPQNDVPHIMGRTTARGPGPSGDQTLPRWNDADRASWAINISRSRRPGPEHHTDASATMFPVRLH